MLTPSEFLNQYLGWGKDVNGAAGIQCVDLAKEHYRLVGVPNYAAPIGGDGYADNIWYNRDRWAAWYDFIPAGAFQDGDMVVFPHKQRGGWTHPFSHVCFWYSGQEFGTNQGVAQATLRNTDWSDALGALRYKGWNTKASIPLLDSDLEINGHKYAMYRQSSTMKTVVLSAGLNQLKTIKELDANAYVVAKASGATFFQMEPDQADPYGTTYGDISAPLNDVFRELPNQDTTLYQDIETGAYGDCTGVHVDPDHNVFSPSVVFPRSGNYQYSRVVERNSDKAAWYINNVTRFAFVIRISDGDYAVGIALQDMTIKQIAEDFRSAYNFVSISFLDGGGSAQMCRWLSKGRKMEYVRDTGREVSSCVAIIDTKPYVQEVPEETEPESKEEMEEEMSVKEEAPQIQTVEDPKWTDPDAGKTTVMDRIVALMAVKSIITLACLFLFGNLVLKGSISSDQFMTVFSVVIAFYFGTTFTKGSK